MFFVDRDLCIACMQCIKDCPTRVISLVEGKAEIHNDKGCIKCGHCVAICPVKAVATDDYDMSEVIPYSKETFAIEPERLMNFIKFRRSVRRFKQKPVEKELIEKIIEAGRFTQTSTNSQDVSYVVITENIEPVVRRAHEVLKQRGEYMLEHVTTETEHLKRYALYWIYLYKEYQKDPSTERILFNAPCVILVTTPNPINGGLASSNMELMVDALKLGTFFGGFLHIAMKEDKELRQMCGVKEGHEVVSCMAIGYPDVKYQRTVPRKPADITWK